MKSKDLSNLRGSEALMLSSIRGLSLGTYARLSEYRTITTSSLLRLEKRFLISYQNLISKKSGSVYSIEGKNWLKKSKSGSNRKKKMQQLHTN